MTYLFGPKLLQPTVCGCNNLWRDERNTMLFGLINPIFMIFYGGHFGGQFCLLLIVFCVINRAGMEPEQIS